MRLASALDFKLIETLFWSLHYTIRLNVSIDSILCSTDNYLALSPSMGNGLQIWMHRDTSSGAPLPVKHVVLLIIAPMSISKNPWCDADPGNILTLRDPPGGERGPCCCWLTRLGALFFKMCASWIFHGRGHVYMTSCTTNFFRL